MSTIGTGDLRFVVGDIGGNIRFQATITNVTLTGTTTGINGDFRSSELLTANNAIVAAVTDFNVGTTADATTVLPGVSERKAPSGVVPTITTSVTSGVVYFTDRFNGQLPEGTKVKIESASATGCQLTSVAGFAVTGDSKEVTVGTEVTFGASYSVTAGGGGPGAIIATITTPIGNVSGSSISCNLLQ
jgi:hypothetical protein